MNLGMINTKHVLSKTRLNGRDSRILLVVFIVTMVLMFVPRIDSDGRGYYAYVRSLAIDHDLDFSNEFYEYAEDFRGLPPQEVKTATGFTQNPWSVGPAILWIPFFALAHLITWLINCAGIPLPLDGYSLVYTVFISMGSAFYGFMGILLTYDILVNHYCLKVKTAMASTILVWFGSPLTMYMYREPAMVHSFAFFSAAMFLYLFFFLTQQKDSLKSWMILGISAGLMILVRWSNVTLFILPFVFALRKTIFNKALLRITLFLLPAFIIFLPQVLIWKIMYGHYLLIPHDLLLPKGEAFMNWASPHFLDVLFSSRHGLFTWTPVMFFAVLGFLWWVRVDRIVSFSLFAALLAQIYLNGAANDWYGGASFGYRRLIEIMPVLTISLGMLINSIKQRWSQYLSVLTGILLLIWNLLFLVQYNRLLIPATSELTFKQIFLDKFTLPIQEIFLFFTAKYLKEMPLLYDSFSLHFWVSIFARILGLTVLSAIFGLISLTFLSRLQKLVARYKL